MKTKYYKEWIAYYAKTKKIEWAFEDIVEECNREIERYRDLIQKEEAAQ